MKKLLLTLFLFLGFFLLYSDDSYANHNTSEVIMSAGVHHNNGSTNWEVAYRLSWMDARGTRQWTGVWKAWTNKIRNCSFPSADWCNRLVSGPDNVRHVFNNCAGCHPSYRMQWGTTCVDPKEDPVYETQISDSYVVLFRANVTLGGVPSANNSGRNISYAYGNTISGRTDLCPFPPPPPTYTIRGYVFIDNNGDGNEDRADGCYKNRFDLIINGNRDNFSAAGCGSGNDPYFVRNTTRRENTVCLDPPNGYVMTNNKCRDTVGDETEKFGIRPADGPIGGKIIKPDGTNYGAGAFVLRKPNQNKDWNEDTRDLSDDKGDYKFPDLNGGSIHDLRLARTKDDLSFEDSKKIDSCVYTTNDNDGTPWVKENVQVVNSSANFRLEFVKYAIRGKLWWDPDGDSASTIPYVDDPPNSLGKSVMVRVFFNGNQQGSDSTDGSLGRRNPKAGTFGIGGLRTDTSGRTYTVKVDTTGKDGIKPAHRVVGGNTKDKTINCNDAGGVDFYIALDAPTYPVSGTIWVDNPSAGTQGAIDSSDTPYTGSYGNRVSQVRLDSGQEVNVQNNGKYTITGVLAGSHNITHLGPLRNNFNRVAPNTKSIVVDGAETVDFLIARNAVLTYSLSGVLFDDTNDPGNRNSDPNINPVNPERITVTSTTGYNQTFPAGSTEFNTAGEFYLGGLSAGTYTVSFTNVRNNWGVSYHPLPYSNIRIGPPPPSPSCPGCRVDDQNNAEGIDFGISQGAAPPQSWIQSVGGDVRWDRNLWTNIVPGGAGNTCTANSTQPYVSSNIVPPGNLSSGIVFTGTNPRFIDSDGNQSSKASPDGWLITGNPFTPSRPGVIRTSYKYVSDAIAKGRPDRVYYVFGSASSRACNQPNPSNCNLKPNLPRGIYKTLAGQSVTIQNATNTFLAGNDYIFLIDGNLTISTNIVVPPGSTATFIVKGNIIVDSGVDRIEGIFSADNNFTVGTTGGVDSPLVVEGNVIANAAHPGTTTATFTSLRTLGTGANGNATCPAVRFVSRPDFILNGPELMRFSNYNIQEVAPQGGN